MADLDILLTHGAGVDLQTLYDDLRANQSTEEADAFLDHLLCEIDALHSLPDDGSVPEELDRLGIRGARHTLVEPYRLIYRVVGKAVFVMVITDSRRSMQALLERRLLGS